MHRSPHVNAIGIDGCRGGWLAAWCRREGAWRVQLFSDLRILSNQFAGATRALIDMPTGLPDTTPRACDAMARRLLGKRACTVFSVPCRAAVYARDYTRACQENQHALGRRLSRQSFNLLPKIRELDTLLREDSALCFLEAHPKLCFMALNGAPVAPSKHSRAGVAARLALLRPHCPVDELIVTTRAQCPTAVAIDDILDALVLAVAAKACVVRLPPQPALDAHGLAMNIHYGPSRAVLACAHGFD